MDNVHRLRNRYAADIVHLMVDKTVRGKAWQIWEAEDAPLAFNFLGYTNGLVFAHENGHNMGLAHDRYESVKGFGSLIKLQRDRGVPSLYSFGYVNQRMFERGAPTSSRWWTVMAYPDQCTDWASERGHDAVDWCYWQGVGPVMRFSNPSRKYNGDPAGVPGNTRSNSANGSANARRSLNDTSRTVANFRRAPCLRNEMEVRLQAANGHYVIAVGNGGGPVRADQRRPGRRGLFTLVDHNGGPCVRSGDVVSLHTSDGFYLRAARGGGAGVDATAPRATPWARFVARRHRGSGASRTGDRLTLQTHGGHYVVAENGGGGEVRADRENAGEWERFRVTAR